jgi:heme-degrading monooxygenase HmoA
VGTGELAVIRSVLFLRPVEGDCAAIQRFFEDEGVLEHAARRPGFLGGELQLPAEPSAPAMVTALWSSTEAYRGWIDDQWRAANVARAKTVFEPIEQPYGGGSVYEVAIAVSPQKTGEERAG